MENQAVAEFPVSQVKVIDDPVRIQPNEPEMAALETLETGPKPDANIQKPVITQVDQAEKPNQEPVQKPSVILPAITTEQPEQNQAVPEKLSQQTPPEGSSMD